MIETLLRLLRNYGDLQDSEYRALKQIMAERRQKYAKLIAAQAQVKQEISRAGNDEATLVELTNKLESLIQEQEEAKGPLLEIEMQVARFKGSKK